jgi:hypothetical protein
MFSCLTTKSDLSHVLCVYWTLGANCEHTNMPTGMLYIDKPLGQPLLLLAWEMPHIRLLNEHLLYDMKF